MVEDVIRLSDGDGDLALEAISIGGGHGRVAVEFALTGRRVFRLLVSPGLVDAGGRERARANESAERGAAVLGEGRVER